VSALVEARAYCEAVTRARARHFYLGLRLTPRPRRDALFALYAWMRRGDDIADDAREPVAQRRLALDDFAERTAAVLDGRDLSALGELGIALADACETCPIERDVFTMTIDGLRADLDHPSCEPAYADDAALDAYCRCVGSTVGRACVAIWGVREPGLVARARELAIERGIAFQRTNILRDIREDYESGRVYIPASAFLAHGLTASELVEWREPERCSALVREQAAYARERYTRSRELESLIAQDCVRVLRTMSGLYEAILSRIEREPSRAATGRARLSNPKKLAVAVVSIVRPVSRSGGRA